MKIYYFSIQVSREHLLAYYGGQAQRVQVTAENHKRLDLPARILRKYVTHQGLSGRFKITLDDDNRLLSLERVG